jgi:hypothetical protein
MKKWIDELDIVESGAKSLLEDALEKNGGILRLAPCWVPRSFLHPGKRLKLHPSDLYAYGLGRGGIDERWFASTTEAANEGRVHDEGLSYVLLENCRLTLRLAVELLGAQMVGEEIWNRHGRWPVYSKFFDNMGPIPLHMHQSNESAALVGQDGKPESYYFPPQHNFVSNNFPYTFFGLEPGTEKKDVVKCLENWERGDNGILDLSRAYRLEPGTGWQVGAGLLHAPGSLCTYEPQWGSDVFGIFQSLVEGRDVPWSLLVKDVPEGKHRDLEFMVDQLDWESNVDPNFRQNHFLRPLVHEENSGEGYEDKWICYGSFDGFQAFTAKELTVQPGVSCRVKDKGAYGMITVQGEGTMNSLQISSPSMIRFGELTNDEIFCSAPAALNGVEFTNTSDKEPLVMLRYFGPEVHPDAPEINRSKEL